MTDRHIRSLDDDTYAKIVKAAAIRGITIGEYIGRLVELHETMRFVGAPVLKRLGLESVRE